MKYSLKKEFITGTAIPVSALRTENSCGIGEFTDLKYFGDWCKECGIDLIQLLPVNDTGTESSPYSALSAFALHPIYINLFNLKESKNYKADIDKIKKKWDGKEKVFYTDVLKAKLTLLKKIYKENQETISTNKNIISWEKKNPWIVTYSVFSMLKDKNKDIKWQDWKKDSDPSAKEIINLYEKNRDTVQFYSWVQFNLEKQLTEVTKYLDSIGINIKGDIPILMNVDSADVWESRDIFKVMNRAGAPPDMFAADGQNWGFPTYDWEEMEKNNFKWWKSRLKQAAKFYHAYRIDHVLGFFRIWTIPPQYKSGSMGYYSPNNFITEEELENIGISEGRLAWMCKPHVPGHELRSAVGIEANECTKYLLDQIGNEDLYLFKESIQSVTDIENCLEISESSKEMMINFYQNVALIKVDENQYTTAWFYYNSRAFHSLSDHEKYLLNELLSNKANHSMELWRDQGLKLLKFMKESEDMLVCAEDLGTIPDCVPEVLEQLGILGLHVTRWSKKYKEYGEPYMKPSEYNYLSVSTPAVHDSTTVRQWWSEFSGSNEIPNALNLEWIGSDPNPDAVKAMYQQLLKTTSQIAMFQFQDLLALDPSMCREDMNSERINVPGTHNSENWSYRIDFTIEQLLTKADFNTKLKELIKNRG
ncbi:MAG: 4-alpha-glucanotransferase [Spirochaetales bacterium]|nr:4-alpha-glucanotransferase [Spirochaetales bacterium]